MRRCIEQKREGEALAAGQWEAIAAAFVEGAIDDAQMAALCMACVLRGMSFEETFALTKAMVESGDVLHFDSPDGIVVDKHSTGGVSDVVSLAAVPLAAACGARVAKLSGRALGHTGGTIDKLETIPGLVTALPAERFIAIVQSVGCAIAAQTEALVPADKRLYRLRDRTATIPALGLIASSIVSKKIAGGAGAFVFDVKAGRAAFLPDAQRAAELAQWLVDLAARFGKRAVAFVTDMSQPLGRCIGTAIEVAEVRDLLQGRGDDRAVELVLAISAALVEEAGVSDAEARTKRALADGSGYAKFTAMIAAQGGDVAAMERMHCTEASTIAAPESGYVRGIDAVALGNAARRLWENDALAGLRIDVRIGDPIERGSPLLTVFGRGAGLVHHLADAVEVGDEPAAAPPLVYARYERSISAMM